MSKLNLKDCTNFIQYKKEMPKGIINIRARCRDISGRMSSVLQQSQSLVNKIDNSCEDTCSSDTVGLFHLEDDDFVDGNNSTTEDTTFYTCNDEQRGY
jgi:hypothetical protein